jgi:hypothetical protein
MWERGERKQELEAAECAMRREREIIEHIWKKGTGRNTEWRRKGDKMDERDMEEEGKNRKKRGER